MRGSLISATRARVRMFPPSCGAVPRNRSWTTSGERLQIQGDDLKAFVNRYGQRLLIHPPGVPVGYNFR